MSATERRLFTQGRRFNPTKKLFYILLLTLFILCGAAAGFGLFGIYRIAQAYEHSSPEYVAKGVLSLFENGEYGSILELSGQMLSRFEEEGDFAAAINEAAPQGEYRFRRSGESSYLLMRGEAPLAELHLSRSDAAGEYGFDVWEIRQLRLIAAEPLDYVVMSPGHLKVFINGQAVTDDNADPQATERQLELCRAVFGDLPQEYFPSSTAVYTVSGLFRPPEVIAPDLDERFYKVGADGQNITLLLTPTPAIIKALTEFGSEAASMYARFITNDADFGDVKGFFLKQSPYYIHLSEFFNDWYNDHDRYSFEQAEFSDWMMYDDYHVTCTVSFVYRIWMGAREFEYPSRYDMAFVRTADGWKVSNLVVA